MVSGWLLGCWLDLADRPGWGQQAQPGLGVGAQFPLCAAASFDEVWEAVDWDAAQPADVDGLDSAVAEGRRRRQSSRPGRPPLGVARAGLGWVPHDQRRVPAAVELGS